MPKKMALVDYTLCNPERCNSGTCQAALVCPHGLLKQETPYETPIPNPSLCQGCARCVVACPVKAIWVS